MNKKAYMKTLEVFIATMITFTFIIYIIPTDRAENNNLADSLLKNIEEDLEFRNCVIMEDTTCLNNKINISFYGAYEYDFLIFDDPLTEPDYLNTTSDKVYTYSRVFSGNYTNYNPKILKIYYWEFKEEKVIL